MGVCAATLCLGCRGQRRNRGSRSLETWVKSTPDGGASGPGGAPWWREQELGARYRSFVGSATDLRWFGGQMTKQCDCGDGLGHANTLHLNTNTEMQAPEHTRTHTSAHTLTHAGANAQTRARTPRTGAPGTSRRALQHARLASLRSSVFFAAFASSRPPRLQDLIRFRPGGRGPTRFKITAIIPANCVKWNLRPLGNPLIQL